MHLTEHIDQCSQAIWRDEGGRALRYLTDSRRVDEDTIRLLRLGYCGAGQKLPDGESEQNGYLFRNKVIVPVAAEFGDPVGVAARSTVKAETGWVNSSATTGFEKGQNLFLLDQSRRAIFEANKAYVFEGYIDGIIALQQGLPNVVAVMGTALTPRHIGLLKRYCDQLCVCFDTDQNTAGQLGAARSLLALHTYGFRDLWRIDLPKGEDPDEFILRLGVAEFKKLERPVTNNDLRLCEDLVRNRS